MTVVGSGTDTAKLSSTTSWFGETFCEVTASSVIRSVEVKPAKLNVLPGGTLAEVSVPRLVAPENRVKAKGIGSAPAVPLPALLLKSKPSENTPAAISSRWFGRRPVLCLKPHF